MGNFDAAKVIEAAATSKLGVISLIVLVLAFLAWRFFQRSEDRVKLIAFAMMFLGAAGFVTAALVAGGDAGDAAPGPQASDAAGSDPDAEPMPLSDSSPAAANIAGVWYHSQGFRYTVAQDGTRFTYKVFYGGAQVGSGGGTIAGTRLTYDFTDETNGNRADCAADVVASASMIRGACDDGRGELSFTLQR